MFKAFISTPLEDDQVARIRDAAAGDVEVIFEPDLLPPTRYVADHKGQEGWTRTAEQAARFHARLAEADFLWDIPPLHMLPTQDMSFAPNLKWVQTTSSGVGPVIEALNMKGSGVTVTTARGVHAVPLAEFTLMALLMHFKDVGRLRREQAAHRWERYCGESLEGKLVAIVGTGEVGRRVAEVCKFHGMRIAAMSRSLTAEAAAELGYDEVFRGADLTDMAARADAIVLCVPHTRETEGMIGRDVIAAMRPQTVLVNIARGQVVDEAALAEALARGRPGFAALDVAAVEPLPDDSPLWGLDNVLISPHSASTVRRENALIADLFIHNMRCMVEGRQGEMRNAFDMDGMY